MHAIKLVNNKQLFYGPIYDFNPVKLETLKVYIKTYHKTGFILFSKFFAGTLILFDKKPESSLYMYVYYQGLNNIKIKNRYLLYLIRKALDYLWQANQFI